MNNVCVRGIKRVTRVNGEYLSDTSTIVTGLTLHCWTIRPVVTGVLVIVIGGG